MTDFPIQNLPFGIFSLDGAVESGRVGVAIGDFILDVVAAGEAGLIDDAAKVGVTAANSPRLNELMSLDPAEVSALRSAIGDLLDSASERGRRGSRAEKKILVPMADAFVHLPAEVGDYSDFYASIDHATSIGTMLRPDSPLLPNYKYIPIGYHGRASSIVPTGTHIQRPSGQIRNDPSAPPVFGPSQRLDYEIEIGAFIGRGNALGAPIGIDQAEKHIFGLCLVSDWSARDIQTWEYQPLGPFLSKSFATTVSPWVVTLDALRPFRRPAFERPAGDPAPLPYLTSERDAAGGGFDITVEVFIHSAQMVSDGFQPVLLSRGSFEKMYWTLAQMVTHHASNGCNLRPGDLIASGTISGPTPESRGCLLERAWRGQEPFRLPTGETRTFLEKDDEIIMRAYCEREGAVRIGFGECSGIVIDEPDDDPLDLLAEGSPEGVLHRTLSGFRRKMRNAQGLFRPRPRRRS